MPTQPIYVEVNPNGIIADLVAAYEAETGNTLQPAQVERLLINMFAYRETLLRSQIQAAAIQNLVSFSTAPILDYLGENFGLVRLAAANAIVTVQFTTNAPATIPSGTRVASVDGLAVFQTLSDIIVSGTTASGQCQSVTSGQNFNGYAIGTITNVLDPQAYIVSATNTDVSAGGSNLETDEQLRNRIRLAPDSYGSAGSRNAYKFWTYSANPLIIDVGVIRPVAGTVEVFPLLEDGSVTPQLILDQVYAILNADEVRPLTDTVIVTAPTQVTYTIDVDVTIYETADATDVQSDIEVALDAYVLQQRQTMGRDIMQDQVIAVCMVEGVYDINLGSFSDLIIATNEYGFCTSITVTVIGTNEG